MVYGGNATPANIGVRFKNQLFYTILGIGSMYQGLNDKFRQVHPIVPACPSLFTKAYPSAETLATSISRLSITKTR